MVVIGKLMFATDVNECAVPDLQTEVCHYGCINTPGSYRCAEPLELKDQPIPEKLPNSCLPGFELSNDGSCLGKLQKPKFQVFNFHVN